MPDEEAFVKITNREIWDKLVEIEKLVAIVPENTKRIRALELKVYTVLAGIVTAFGGILIAVAQRSF
jgi:hypothetical protein